VSSDRAVTGAPAATNRPRLSDIVLAAVVTAAQLVVVQAASWSGHHTGLDVGGYVAFSAAGASLVFRRRYPDAVLAAALIATFLVRATSHAGAVWLILVVAFFNAVLYRRRLAAIASLVIGYLVALWPPWLIGSPGGTSVAAAAWLAAWLLVLLSVAELIRMRRQRAAAVARGREEEMRRLASEERMRMARDLHDVVAHNISVINVQANTALHLMDRQPERAWAALSTINDVSKRALVELRSVLGVLRQVDEGEPRSPAPGLARLDDLVERADAAGLKVRVELAGERTALPANVDLAAYRIIQEALTNCARHAPGSQVVVRITWQDSDVEVQVDDEGGAGAGQPAPVRPARVPGGNGLAGMRERANAIHGTLAAGPRPEGGFRVRARLPFPGAAQ
jgi:signal transduction histidine kinase